MKRDGFTLIELLVVISIIGILAIALGFSFEGWQGRYKVESRIKEVESDLNKARSSAMQRNRVHFFTLDSAAQYTVYEDNDPPPDGDGILDADLALPSYPKFMEFGHKLIWNGAEPDEADPPQITFNTRGLIQPTTGTMCVFSDPDDDGVSDIKADYDCLVLSQTRISIGQINPDIAQTVENCVNANCVRR